MSERVDILVALNSETIDIHRGEVDPAGLIVFDRTKTKVDETGGGHFLDVPLERLATETGGDRLMSNSVAIGAVFGLIDYRLRTAISRPARGVWPTWRKDRGGQPGGSARRLRPRQAALHRRWIAPHSADESQAEGS